MTKDEKRKVILQTIGERLAKKKRKNMTKKEAASIITKWAKAWLEQRKMHQVVQETNPIGKADTSIEDIIDQELKMSDDFQIKEITGKKSKTTVFYKETNPMNILIKNKNGYEYNIEKYQVSTTKKTMKVPLTLK